ncbi:MAG: SH3 domain-containing protein [Lachnospiraceae bacterium]|jgi:outer membrane biosynthesis protein TonB|nr:SH3 domain-containing protein [Lachnospiraceae bacterium]
MNYSRDDSNQIENKNKSESWVMQYKKQVVAGVILVGLVIATIYSVVGKGDGKSEVQAQAQAQTPSETQTPEEPEKEETKTKTSGKGAVAAFAPGVDVQGSVDLSNDLKRDEYPEVNAVVQQYFDSMAAGDMEAYSAVVDEITEEEKERILSSKDIVEGYQNISCYTKRGLEEGSYLVFVYYEQKFLRIETPAPGLSPLYVRTNDEGNLYVFKGEVSPELNSYVEEMAQSEDVVSLRDQVKAQYEEAKAADEELMKLADRYAKIVEESDSSEEEPEETPEEAPEETPEEEPQEEPEEEPEEEPADNGEATSQNRETRFTESVRLRSEPSTEAENLGTAFQGEAVTQIESYSDGWSKINYNGKECYCKTEFLE